MHKNLIQITSITILAIALTQQTCAIGYPMDKERVLPLRLSQDAPTRINIEGEKISDVFFYPEGAVKVTLHPSGNLFVVPEKDTKTAQLTVMGEGGSVQDLKLTFGKKEPGPVTLYQQNYQPCDGCLSDDPDTAIAQTKQSREGGESEREDP